MQPADQTKFGMPNGNCFQACVASILGFSISGGDTLEAFPTFHNDLSNGNWFKQWQEWLVARGYRMVYYGHPDPKGSWTVEEARFVAPRGYCIMSGHSPRGAWLHATVAFDGEMVHDPHPDRTGTLDVTDFIVFERIENGSESL